MTKNHADIIALHAHSELMPREELENLASKSITWWDTQSQDLRFQATRAFALAAQQALHEPALQPLVHTLTKQVKPLCTASYKGISLSYYPTREHSSLRYMPRDLIEPLWRPYFAPPHRNTGDIAHNYVGVFVDPEEFHFRTFEYILPMDTHFEDTPCTWEPQPLTQPNPDLNLFYGTLHLDEDTTKRLLAIDQAELYLRPLNIASRGGKRLIFHTEKLAQSLTKAIAECLPQKMLERFVHINPVFRLNRFSPSDTPFKSHYDSPYSDPVRKHISRYTLLLYLSEGSSEQAILRVQDHQFKRLEAMTCVIFDQSLEHEGLPYHDNEKLFLRTELIFEADHVSHNPHLSKTFSRACALTSDSLFDQELAGEVHTLYDRAAAAHWHDLKPDKQKKITYHHKHFGPVEFLSNGHDYWFPRAQELSLKACAAITVLDYFNCKLEHTSFRKLCTRKSIKQSPDTSWVDSFFTHVTPLAPFEKIEHMHKNLLAPEPRPADPNEEFPAYLYELNDGIVRGMNAQAFTSIPAIVDVYAQQRDHLYKTIHHAPIMLMGDEVFLDEELIQIEGNKIFIGSHKELEPVNFAASTTYNHTPEDYVTSPGTINAPYLLIPPLLFFVTDTCYHLTCDFFRNGWMVSHSSPHAAEIPEFTWPW